MTMRSPDREVVPQLLCAGDPCAGDEALYDPAPWENARDFAGWTDERAWRALDARFHALYLQVLAGHRPFNDPALRDVAHRLGLDGPRWFDARPPRTAETAIPDEVLADVTEDWVPDLGVMAERLTADDGPPTVGVAAALAYVGCAVDGTRPVDAWADEEAERALVRAARVVDASPPGVWADGRPLLPTLPARVPEAVPPGVFVARAYRVSGGWAWSGRMDLDHAPDPGPLVARLTLELWRLRRHERRATWEDLLRRRPEVVYRAAAEGARRARREKTCVSTT